MSINTIESISFDCFEDYRQILDAVNSYQVEGESQMLI